MAVVPPYYPWPAAPIGWTCSACGKGNAPEVKGCVHCAKREPTSTTSNWAPGFSAIMTPRRAGDMKRGF